MHGCPHAIHLAMRGRNGGKTEGVLLGDEQDVGFRGLEGDV